MSANGKIDPSLGLVILTVLFTVYGQLVIKWRVLKVGALPAEFSKKLLFLLSLLIDPWVISGMLAALIAGLCWMAAMTRLQLSYAYPFMSLAFVLVLILSNVIFHESLTVLKVLGVAVVITGLIIASQG